MDSVSDDSCLIVDFFEKSRRLTAFRLVCIIWPRRARRSAEIPVRQCIDLQWVDREYTLLHRILWRFLKSFVQAYTRLNQRYSNRGPVTNIFKQSPQAELFDRRGREGRHDRALRLPPAHTGCLHAAE